MDTNGSTRNRGGGSRKLDPSPAVPTRQRKIPSSHPLSPRDYRVGVREKIGGASEARDAGRAPVRVGFDAQPLARVADGERPRVPRASRRGDGVIARENLREFFRGDDALTTREDTVRGERCERSPRRGFVDAQPRRRARASR